MLIFVYYIVNLEVAVGNTFLDFVFGIWAYAENVLFIGFSAFSCWTPGRPWHPEGQKGSREVWFVTQCSLQNKLCDKLKTESYVSTTPTRLRKRLKLYCTSKITYDIWSVTQSKFCWAVKISSWFRLLRVKKNVWFLSKGRLHLHLFLVCALLPTMHLKKWLYTAIWCKSPIK